jgi:hypothetical protein
VLWIGQRTISGLLTLGPRRVTGLLETQYWLDGTAAIEVNAGAVVAETLRAPSLALVNTGLVTTFRATTIARTSSISTPARSGGCNQPHRRIGKELSRRADEGNVPIEGGRC